VAFPPLLEGSPPPHGWRAAEDNGRVDAVVISAALPGPTLSRLLLLREKADPLLPVVSLVPTNQTGMDEPGLETPWDCARAIQARLRQIPDSVRHSANPEDLLLARLYSRENDLQPAYDSGVPECLRYPAAGLMTGVAETALRLESKGLLSRQFFDRFHTCVDCGSARLSVREECHKCRSADLREEVMVHHFRCAHIGPESQFRSGVKYECPKCGQALRHIGLDYDKPGSVSICNTCSAVSDSAAIGFKCIDCGSHHDTAQVPCRDWFSFRLTPHGVQSLLQGQAAISSQGRLAAFDLLLEQAIRENREFKTPYQLVRLSFANGPAIRAEDRRLWDMTLNLVQDALHSALREVDVFRYEGDFSVLILMPHSNERSVQKALSFVGKRLDDLLKVDPGAQYEILDPGAVRGLRNEAA
jgi:hypothetical protein